MRNLCKGNLFRIQLKILWRLLNGIYKFLAKWKCSCMIFKILLAFALIPWDLLKFFVNILPLTHHFSSLRNSHGIWHILLIHDKINHQAWSKRGKCSCLTYTKTNVRRREIVVSGFWSFVCVCACKTFVSSRRGLRMKPLTWKIYKFPIVKKFNGKKRVSTWLMLIRYLQSKWGEMLYFSRIVSMYF